MYVPQPHPTLEDRPAWRRLARVFQLPHERFGAAGITFHEFDVDFGRQALAASQCNALLSELARYNARLIRELRRQGTPLPALYESGAVFADEPWQGVCEEFAPIDWVIARGWGDCDDLLAARLGEHLASGVLAFPRTISPPQAPGEPNYYHGTIRHVDGSWEDPSAVLDGPSSLG